MSTCKIRARPVFQSFFLLLLQFHRNGIIRDRLDTPYKLFTSNIDYRTTLRYYLYYYYYYYYIPHVIMLLFLFHFLEIIKVKGGILKMLLIERSSRSVRSFIDCQGSNWCDSTPYATLSATRDLTRRSDVSLHVQERKV